MLFVSLWEGESNWSINKFQNVLPDSHRDDRSHPEVGEERQSRCLKIDQDK